MEVVGTVTTTVENKREFRFTADEVVKALAHMCPTLVQAMESDTSEVAVFIEATGADISIDETVSIIDGIPLRVNVRTLDTEEHGIDG